VLCTRPTRREIFTFYYGAHRITDTITRRNIIGRVGVRGVRFYSPARRSWISRNPRETKSKRRKNKTVKTTGRKFTAVWLLIAYLFLFTGKRFKNRVFTITIRQTVHLSKIEPQPPSRSRARTPVPIRDYRAALFRATFSRQLGAASFGHSARTTKSLFHIAIWAAGRQQVKG